VHTPEESIQQAIASASDGDTVLVEPGRYFENLSFLGRRITLRSTAGADATIIDGQARGSCVVFDHQENNDTVLEGFTLMNGSGTPVTPGGYGVGGAVLIREAGPTIKNNIFTANRSEGLGLDGFGGAIWCVGELSGVTWSPVIANNVFTNNVAGLIGGAIGARNNMSLIVSGNAFRSNITRWGDGGAIYLGILSPGAHIVNNKFYSNIAGDHGGALYCTSANPNQTNISIDIRGNLFSNNTAEGREMSGTSGGGVWMQNVQGWVHENTFVRNAGQGIDSTWGGAMAVGGAGTILIERNVIVLSEDGGGIQCVGNTVITIRDNLSWRNLPTDGSGSCEGWEVLNGNIVGDPCFCAVSGDLFLLAENSPALLHPAGPLGYAPGPGCEAKVAVVQTTWGRVKALFHTSDK
jgi:hypothetical protein